MKLACRITSLVLCMLSAPLLAERDKLREVPAEEALARRFPEETVLITFVKDGQPGITVLGNNAFQGVVALKKTDPAHEAIAETGQFVIAYPGGDMEKEVLHCLAGKGTRAEAFTTSPGRRVNAPRLEKCIINYECKVGRKLDAGDSTIFLGRIVSTYRTRRKVARLFITGYEKGQPILKAFEGARGIPAPRGFEKYPEQTVMIVSCGRAGKPNAMTASWTMRVSDDPPMVAVSIGKRRYTHGLIRATRQFVYVYPGADMQREMHYCGTHSGRYEDKFKALKLATQPAKKVRPPLLSKALAAFECTVVGEMDDGSHTIYVGRIEAAYVSDKDVPRIYNLGTVRGRARVFKALPASGKAATSGPSTRPAASR